MIFLLLNTFSAVAGQSLSTDRRAQKIEQRTKAASSRIYKDSTSPIPDRVRDLLGRMTLEEKVAQLQSFITLDENLLTGMSSSGGSNPASAIPKLLEKGGLNEALVKRVLGNGIGTINHYDFRGSRSSAQTRNLLQEWVIKNTRLGIPVMFHGEALHGAMEKGATSFPQAVGLGSTWDPELLKEMFTAVALETRAAGISLALAPVLDLSRDPRYGRMQEMYSEDPFLTAQLGVAAVLGLQGDSNLIDQNHVFATAKHFVHGQPENGTNVGPSDFSERTMREVFLYPFEQAVKKGRIGAVMPSYNETNGGIPSHANPWLLKQVLRKEWGFTGLTVSDYTGVTELATLQHVAADQRAAAMLALKSGVDVELPLPLSYPTLIEAVRSGAVSQAEIDAAVERVLTAKFRAGLFENPLADLNRIERVVGNKKHAELARKVADKSIVLLKNSNNLLPLDASQIKTIAVIGPNANKERLGNYSGMPGYFVNILDGIRQRVGSGTKVVYAEGCRISETDPAPFFATYTPYHAPSAETDTKLLNEAVDVAGSADVIVLALGDNEVVTRESFPEQASAPVMSGDTDTLELPGRQNELVRRISKLGKPVVAVLLNGRAYAVTELADQVPAIVEGWYLGQETGNAIAGVLFGDVNPSGRLPVTIARNAGQLPVYYYKKPAARRGYVFDTNKPLFPFGFGLGYTTFAYGKPTVDRERISTKEQARVSVTVTNTGKRAGDEVVQMYINRPVSSVVQPVLMLRGFKRVFLEPGKSVTVTFELGADELSFLDAAMRKTVEPGIVNVLIGPNSAETAAVQLTIAP